MSWRNCELRKSAIFGRLSFYKNLTQFISHHRFIYLLLHNKKIHNYDNQRHINSRLYMGYYVIR